MGHHLLTVNVRNEQDIVAVRQRARQISELLKFGAINQTRIATTLSELGRRCFALTARLRIEFVVEKGSRGAALRIDIRNMATEVGHDNAGMEWDNRDSFAFARQLMDNFEVVESEGRFIRLVLSKTLPKATSVDNEFLLYAREQVGALPSASTFAELDLQNKELLQALAEVRAREEELATLAQELEETNRGVVALYVELEEKAESLRKADAMKSRFLSNTSHELRTPLSSIRALARLLLGRLDGELSEEQDHQVRLISKAAEELSAAVDDLLDLAKIEAGKVDVTSSSFMVGELFGSLRGVLRPLSSSEAVALVFDGRYATETLHTDEGKLSQILRNFISNALKFTERGEVRVSAEPDVDNDAIQFNVTDTGIGIRPEDLDIIFEEFSQIENPLQKRVKGTGLGLPLCRKLAELLGGNVTVASEPEAGSTFSVKLPIRNTAKPTLRTSDHPSIDEVAFATRETNHIADNSADPARDRDTAAPIQNTGASDG